MLRLGYLDQRDPLYGWMTHDILPQTGLRSPNPTIQVYWLNASHKVYLYEALHNGLKFQVVGKFYGKDPAPYEDKRFRLRLEVDNICRLRGLGFDNGPYRVVRCLGHNEYINCALMLDYAPGHKLDHFIKDAIYQGHKTGLYRALSDLAHFLSLLHSRSRDQAKVNFNQEYAYFQKTLSHLTGRAYVSGEDIHRLHELARLWRKKPAMWLAPSVQVHGDCTPTNLIFSEYPKLVVVDLERSRRSDPAFDTGRVAGELKHHFMMLTGDGEEAEPFIHHFYREYCSSSFLNTFQEITERNPFYQAVTELRIAKNYWLTPDYRRLLVQEAKKCLRIP